MKEKERKKKKKKMQAGDCRDSIPLFAGFQNVVVG